MRSSSLSPNFRNPVTACRKAWESSRTGLEASFRLIIRNPDFQPIVLDVCFGRFDNNRRISWGAELDDEPSC